MIQKIRAKLGYPFPMATCVLMTAITVAFLAEIVFGFASHQFTTWIDVVGIGTRGQVAVFREMGGMIPGQFQPWRLLTLLFLHAGVIHYGLNISALYSFRDVEQRIGAGKFLGLFFFGGICSGLGAALFLFFSPQTGFIVGASGGLWAILIAYVVHEGRVRKIGPRRWIFLSLILLPFLYLGNFFAHLAGVCGGLLFYRVFLWNEKGE